jgi:hypothetical protein
MTLTRLVLTFAFTGIVANLYMKSRRGTGLLSGSSAGAPTGAMPAPDDQPSSVASQRAYPPASTSATPAATTSGTESPNAAERLQAQGVAQTTGDGRADNQFQSTSQDSPYASSPGLPDFTRGA